MSDFRKGPKPRRVRHRPTEESSLTTNLSISKLRPTDFSLRLRTQSHQSHYPSSGPRRPRTSSHKGAVMSEEIATARSAKAGGGTARGWRSELELCALTQPDLRVSPRNNAVEGRVHSSTPPAVGPCVRRNLISCRPKPHKNETGLPNHNPKPTPAWLSGGAIAPRTAWCRTDARQR